MADYSNKVPGNVPGKWFVDSSCVDCGLCPDTAPHIFRRDDEGGTSVVHSQPEASDPLALEAMEACPTESIGNDGAD